MQTNSVKELITFLSGQNITTFDENVLIFLREGNRTQRAEEILRNGFIRTSNADINIIVAENTEGYFEIRIIADSGRFTGKQINKFAQEIEMCLSGVENLELLVSNRSDIDKILRYIFIYDN
ncbi:MAG: hypothetical protein ACI37T_01955 [Candidatus Gastranaerophilaceae bacterium]